MTFRTVVTKSLGKSGDITKAQHCRAEVYIEHKGWLPVDPADVRKVALEEDIPVDSDKVKILRERLFGSWEMNWVGFNYARDFPLPGQQDGPIGFLMYPYAETAQGVKDSLDPDAFAYTIASNEVHSTAGNIHAGIALTGGFYRARQELPFGG